MLRARKFWHGIFWGIIFWVLLEAHIRSSPSLEIRSTPPPPPPGLLKVFQVVTTRVFLVLVNSLPKKFPQSWSMGKSFFWWTKVQYSYKSMSYSQFCDGRSRFSEMYSISSLPTTIINEQSCCGLTFHSDYRHFPLSTIIWPIFNHRNYLFCHGL